MRQLKKVVSNNLGENIKIFHPSSECFMLDVLLLVDFFLGWWEFSVKI
jgi:hypothetical protein